MKLLTASVLTVALLSPIAGAQISVVTSRNNNNRDGQNLNETILTPGNVNVGSFGKVFSQPVDGYIYAQPLYVPNVSIPALGNHNVVYVATEHDSVYAFDADNNKEMNASPLWQTSFIDPAHGITTVSSDDVDCTDLVPEIGISSTPVIDPSTQTIYVVAKTKENGQFVQRLHALDITSGAERAGSPVVISATVRGNGDGSSNGYVTFDPLREAQRPGLLLQNGTVFIAWASHCDNGPYHGWVMGYNESTLKQVNLWNTTPNGGLGGVWQSGTGLASDGTYVFFATGNGTYDGPSGGRDFGDSVVKVPAALKLSHPYDYFTPYDQGSFDGADTDVGSGGVLLLPDQGAGAPHRHLLVESGKSGDIYLINRDHMGGYNPHNNSQIVQDLEGAVGGMWATPAWWNNNVYFGGSGDYLRQYSFNPTTGLLSNGSVAASPTYFGFPGATPSISANGSNNAIVWALQTDNYGSGSATLHAYDAVNIGTELYNSNQNPSRDDAGGAVKFTVPTVANGRVYVPAAQQLSVYGLVANVTAHRMVTSVNPNNGPAMGGTPVTITGVDFVTGATVTFGGTPATNVVVLNSTTITATTPAHTAGSVTVTVTDPDTRSGSLLNGFTYNSISFVQVAAATPQSVVQVVPVAYPAAQTAGDLNIVVVGWNDASSTVQSVTDSEGNHYSLAIGPTSGTNLRQSIYYASNIAGGSNTVMVNFNQAAAFPDVRILEYQGVGALDVTAGASGNSASADSGPATTGTANELVFGANTVFTGTVAAGNGFTSRIITSPDGDIAEDEVANRTGVYSATAPLNSDGPWVMQMATFKAATPESRVGKQTLASGTSGQKEKRTLPR